MKLMASIRKTRPCAAFAGFGTFGPAAEVVLGLDLVLGANDFSLAVRETQFWGSGCALWRYQLLFINQQLQRPLDKFAYCELNCQCNFAICEASYPEGFWK